MANEDQEQGAAGSGVETAGVAAQPSPEESSGGNTGVASGSIDLGPVKRKRGRPPGTKNKPKAEGSGLADTVVSVDPTYFVETVIEVLKLGDDILRDRLITELKKRIPEKVPEFQTLLEKRGFNEADERILRPILKQLCLKYDWLTKFGPEACLGIWLVQYLARTFALLKFVKSFPVEPAEAAKRVAPAEPAKG